MPPSLESCPDDVIAEVVDLLDLEDICNLRVSCRALATKSSTHHFKAFFHQKSLDLTEDALRNFIEGVRAGGLRCLLRHLRLVAIVDQSKAVEDESEEDMRNKCLSMLTEAFESLTQNSADDMTISLELRVEIKTHLGERIMPDEQDLHGPSRLVWHAAAATFDTASRALAASSLRIDSLNIFNGPDQQRCSLEYYYFNAIDWSDPRLIESLAPLRSLSMSLSKRVSLFAEDYVQVESRARENEEQEEEENSNVEDESTSIDYSPSTEQSEAEAEPVTQPQDSFSGLLHFVSLYTELDLFEIHHFKVANNVNHPELPVLQRLVELDALPRIKHCRLRGLYLGETELLSFIQRVKPQELSLERIPLRGGTFQSIFDYCTSESTCVDSFYFDSLSVDGFPVHFRQDENFRQFESSATPAFLRLRRKGDGAKLPISYNIPRSPMGTPEIYEWWRYLRREYG